MLHSLFLNNFRSWKKSTIEFCPGVNVITGENDSGKTNILRGINWVANNRPAGEDIRSYWGGDSISRLTVRDGNISKFIGRRKRRQFGRGTGLYCYRYGRENVQRMAQKAAARSGKNQRPAGRGCRIKKQ